MSVSELTCHPSCQPFQQRLFHLGGHIPEVFPTHWRKRPSSTFFKSRGSHPFSNSQVMTAMPEANCGNSAYKIQFVGTKSLRSRKDLCSLWSVCTYYKKLNRFMFTIKVSIESLKGSYYWRRKGMHKQRKFISSATLVVFCALQLEQDRSNCTWQFLLPSATYGMWWRWHWW